MPCFRYIPFPCKPLARKRGDSPFENSSTYAKPPEGVPENAPQPSSGCLRTAFHPNANRPRPNLGSTTPLFTLFYKNVKALLPYPLEPGFPSVRTVFPPNARRGDRNLGSEGWKTRGRQQGEANCLKCLNRQKQKERRGRQGDGDAQRKSLPAFNLLVIPEVATHLSLLPPILIYSGSRLI